MARSSTEYMIVADIEPRELGPCEPPRPARLPGWPSWIEARGRQRKPSDVITRLRGWWHNEPLHRVNMGWHPRGEIEDLWRCTDADEVSLDPAGGGRRQRPLPTPRSSAWEERGEPIVCPGTRSLQLRLTMRCR